MYVALSGAPSCSNASSGQAADDVERVGEALGRGEAGARVDDVGAPAADARERRQVLGVLDGAEDDDPRIGAR